MGVRVGPPTRPFRVLLLTALHCCPLEQPTAMVSARCLGERLGAYRCLPFGGTSRQAEQAAVIPAPREDSNFASPALWALRRRTANAEPADAHNLPA